MNAHDSVAAIESDVWFEIEMKESEVLARSDFNEDCGW
jgi:hypothetical protein